MTTIGNMVADARRMAYGGMSEPINTLAAVGAGATALTFNLDISGLQTGSIVSSGLNVWYVTSVDTTTKIAQVIPNYDDSQSLAVNSGDIAYINPRATAWYLFTTMQDVIRSMSSPKAGLYRIGQFTLDTDGVWNTYSIPTEAQGMRGLLGARVLYPGTPDTWVEIPRQALMWQQDQNIIRCTRPLPSGTSVEFRYKASFTVPVSLGQDPIADVGLTDTMVDIPALGTVVTLLRTTEGRRVSPAVQGDSRRAGEVGAGANLTAAREFERDYNSRLGEEALRLVGRNPYRQDF